MIVHFGAFKFQMLLLICMCLLVEATQASSNYHLLSATSTFPPKSSPQVKDPTGKTTKYIYLQREPSPFYDQSKRHRINTRPFLIEASHMQVPHSAQHQQTPALKSPHLVFLPGHQVISGTLARESYSPQRVIFPASNLPQGDQGRTKLRAENLISSQLSKKDDDFAVYQKTHQRRTSEIENQLPTSKYGFVSSKQGSFQQGTKPGSTTETVLTQPNNVVDPDHPDSAVTVVMDSTIQLDYSEPDANTRYEGTIGDDYVTNDIEDTLEDLGIGEEYFELHDKLLRDVQLIQDFVNSV